MLSAFVCLVQMVPLEGSKHAGAFVSQKEGRRMKNLPVIVSFIGHAVSPVGSIRCLWSFWRYRPAL